MYERNQIADCNLNDSGITVVGYHKESGLSRFNIYTTGGLVDSMVKEYIGTVEIIDGKVSFFQASRFEKGNELNG